MFNDQYFFKVFFRHFEWIHPRSAFCQCFGLCLAKAARLEQQLRKKPRAKTA